MLELWGCFFLIYGIYIPPAIAVTLYKPQLLSIWLISVCLATLPLIITSVIYVQVQYNLSATTTTSFVFRASEQTILLVLSIMNVYLQWLVKVSMFVILAKWQHKYAHTVILDNNKIKQITTKTTEGNSAQSNTINSTNNSKIHNKVDLQHEVVFWSTRFRTLPLSMTVGAAFGFVSVIANTSTQFDLTMQLEKFGASHLSSYNFDICPQLPSLVHVALQSCLLSFAHIAWGAMTGQVIFALVELGLGTYWNQYCFIVGQSETWGQWWEHSAWRQVHNYNNNKNSNNHTTTTTHNKTTIASNSNTVTSINVVSKENKEENGNNTNMNITNHTIGSITWESARRCNECVEDHRVLEQEEMLSLEENNSGNTMQEIQSDCKEKNKVNKSRSRDEITNLHLFLSTEREEEQEQQDEKRYYHKHREEQEEQEEEEEEEEEYEELSEEEEENETPVDPGTVNTEIHNEQVNGIHVSSVSDSVFVDDGTHKLVFAIMWLVLYFVLQMIFTILPIFYHRHGAFDVITMRESNRTGCVVTLPVELVLVTISYIGFVWLAREEEVHNEIE